MRWKVNRKVQVVPCSRPRRPLAAMFAPFEEDCNVKGLPQHLLQQSKATAENSQVLAAHHSPMCSLLFYLDQWWKSQLQVGNSERCLMLQMLHGNLLLFPTRASTRPCDGT